VRVEEHKVFDPNLIAVAGTNYVDMATARTKGIQPGHIRRDALCHWHNEFHAFSNQSTARSTILDGQREGLKHI
jgi:hypothetical protein